MTAISGITFSAVENNKNSESPKVKKEIVYVSKTPQAAVNATGVVAGTGGMLGGAILGGIVGLSKLPGEYVKQIAGQNYSKIAEDALAGFKEAISSSPELSAFTEALKEVKSPMAAEEVIEIAKTLSERLHATFAEDVHASAVLDKIVDPLIDAISLKRNFRSYGSGLRDKIESPVGQIVLKLIGFNRKTSTIMKNVIGNIAGGITKVVENMKNLSPEEQEAWKKVSVKIFEEFEQNPKIKLSKNMPKAIYGMVKNFDWISKPLQNMQQTIKEAAGNINTSLGKAPIKTIGIYSLVGAVTCGALSLLGWFGLKKGLMKKEVEKSQMIKE